MTGNGVTIPDRSPWGLREELVRRVTADLLGPLGGDEEVLRGYQRDDGLWSSPGRVRDRYLVGVLAPKGTVAVDPERDDDVGPEEGDDTNTGGVQDGRSPRMVLAQSSMGLSVVVDASVESLVARCRWGQYDKESQQHDDGSRSSVWVRRPVQVDVPVPLAEGEFGPVDVDGEGVVLRGRATRSGGGLWLVTVFLSNEREQAERNRDSRWMFQAGLELFAADGAAVFLGRGGILAEAAAASQWERDEVAQLDLQYRDTVEFAVGHGVGTEVEVSASDPRRAVQAATAVIPSYEVWRTDAPRAETTPQLAGLVTDMKALSELDPDGLRAALLPLSEGYRRWLDTETARVDDPEARLEGHEQAARAAIGQARQIADAIEAGIERVCSDTDALEAFRFANEAMRLQRVHTVAIDDRRRDPELGLREAVEAADVPENRSWRPFQLAFILLCVPSLRRPRSP